MHMYVYSSRLFFFNFIPIYPGISKLNPSSNHYTIIEIAYEWSFKTIKKKTILL